MVRRNYTDPFILGIASRSEECLKKFFVMPPASASQTPRRLQTPSMRPVPQTINIGKAITMRYTCIHRKIYTIKSLVPKPKQIKLLIFFDFIVWFSFFLRLPRLPYNSQKITRIVFELEN